jgi:hypothetical protein
LDGKSFTGLLDQAVQIEAGRQAFLVVGGEGLDTVPASGFRISGSAVTIDTSRIIPGTIRTGADAGKPFVILPVSVLPEALPGARSLYVTRLDEQAAFTGCLEVVTSPVSSIGGTTRRAGSTDEVMR